MAVQATGRITVAQQVSRVKTQAVGGFAGKRLALEVSGPQGTERRAVEVLKDLPGLLGKQGVRVDFYTPGGQWLNPECLVWQTAEQIDVLATEIDKLFSGLIDATETHMIMKGEVSVALFREIIRGVDFKIADVKLQALVNDPSLKEQSIGHTYKDQARRFARRLSDLTGREWIVPGEAEWEATGDILEGTNWSWTSAKYTGKTVQDEPLTPRKWPEDSIVRRPGKDHEWMPVHGSAWKPSKPNFTIRLGLRKNQ